MGQYQRPLVLGQASQAADVEAVHAAELGQVAGQRPQIAFGADPLRASEDLRRGDRDALDRGALGDERRDARRAFLGLQRAGREDDLAVGRRHLHGGGQQPVLEPDQRR